MGNIIKLSARGCIWNIPPPQQVGAWKARGGAQSVFATDADIGSTWTYNDALLTRLRARVCACGLPQKQRVVARAPRLTKRRTIARIVVRKCIQIRERTFCHAARAVRQTLIQRHKHMHMHNTRGKHTYRVRYTTFRFGADK